MKFYLCHTAEGRKRLVTRQDEARKLDKAAELIELPTDQAGLKQAFEELFDQITDLESQLPSDATEIPVSENLPKTEGYAEKSVRFEDEFEAMPLAKQLHFAALAMENARERL